MLSTSSSVSPSTPVVASISPMRRRLLCPGMAWSGDDVIMYAANHETKPKDFRSYVSNGRFNHQLVMQVDLKTLWVKNGWRSYAPSPSTTLIECGHRGIVQAKGRWESSLSAGKLHIDLFQWPYSTCCFTRKPCVSLFASKCTKILPGLRLPRILHYLPGMRHWLLQISASLIGGSLGQDQSAFATWTANGHCNPTCAHVHPTFLVHFIVCCP